ncbi:tRNA (adenine(22)-N(1))-methyltransferase TrmK [Amphritea sp. 1_MG-2023]|uniref:tRNA (adenine(22)-N(1))-methyltransferase n=1 Tax=Amphritea sp. 1_MG-2023 TaxID=3062670 RepID=UPI0026E244B0|nr:tRNA (adenine(22)-N(1))-methyltransferase TrmK [Amphritea sp. 1_MG-2023]MDO6563510.1 tRNA (adenine(22)-N(1))-methyltransferase TrmK [Amphritea sp. 1_MG-2023]
MKLSKRLTQIKQLVAPGYSHIWDCCCDHGHLGAALLSQHSAQIHFVDIVPTLITELESRLQQHYPDIAERWTTHCLDVAALPLEQHSGRQLIIIAGVGGDLIQQFVQTIQQQHPHLNLDFLLCPVRHQFALRQTLIELNFSSKNEALIEENQRFYEIMLVSADNNAGTSISPVGEALWQADSDEQRDNIQRYLHTTLNHYQRMQQGSSVDVSHIIEAYRSVSI